MSEPISPNQRRRLWAVGLLVFALACDGGSGCSGLGGGCDGLAGGCADSGCADSGCGLGGSVPYPASGSIIDQAAQVRLSDHGISFLQANAGPLVANLVGEDGLSFCVPKTGAIGIDICGGMTCDDGTEGCQLDLEIDSLSIRPTDHAPDDDSLDVTAFLNIDDVMSVTGCDEMHIIGQRVPADVSVTMHIDASTSISANDPIPGASDKMWVEVGGINSSFANLTFEPVNEGDGGCLAVAFLLNASIPAVGSALIGPLADGLVGDLLCTACTEEGACEDGAYCNADNVCIYSAGAEQCVPIWLGLETEFDLGSLLSDFAPQLENALSIIFFTGNYADAEADGMSIGAFAGAYAPHDDCVPNAAEPPTALVAKSAALIADVTPFGNPFHLGIGVSEQFIEQALWAAYQSGALCIAVGSDLSDFISSGTFSFFLPSLSALTEGRNVPMILRLRPSSPPTVTLGTGEVAADGTVVDPLLIVEMAGLNIDFYAFMEQRFARIFTLDTDVALPLALTPADGGGIQILLGDLGEAFTRVDPLNAELLAEEDVAELANVLPSLIGGLAPTLASALDAPIDIPEFGGYRLELAQDSFTSIEDRTMLAIFANLAPAETDGGTGGVQFMPTARARVASVDGPSARELAELRADRRRGQVVRVEDIQTTLTLEVETLGDPGADREYSYRINSGLWHVYQQGPLIEVADPTLLIEGHHAIEVRSRVAGLPNSLSLPSEPVNVTIDLAQPDLELRAVGEYQVEVQSWDSVWDTHELELFYRFDDGEWETVPANYLIQLPQVGEHVELTVESSDGSGHSRLVTRTFAVHGRTTDTSDSGGGCGNCAVTAVDGSSPKVGGWALWLLGLLALGRRRATRRVRAPKRLLSALFALAAIALPVGCGDDPPVTSLEDDTTVGCGDGCEGDQMCMNDMCVDNVCAADDECPEELVCVGDRCVVRTRCDSNADCLDGQFCIDDDDDGGSECLSMPCEGNADCSGLTCGGGRLAYCIEESCFCEFPCAEGCEDEQYCCNATSSCLDVPNVCEPLECEVGFGPAVVTDAEGDPDSCEVSGPDCECQELPPLPMGDIGAYLSTDAAADGTIYVAAFNRTYADLMVGRADAELNIEWWFVDGLPDSGDVTGSLNGPRGGIADGGPSLGRHTSLVVDDGGNLHVVYRSETDGALKYGRGVPSGEAFDWTFQLVDEEQSAGPWANLLLDSDDVPVAVYLVPKVEVEPGVWHAQIRRATADANNPTEWTYDTVASNLTPLACGGPCVGTARCYQETNTCTAATRSSFCSPECGDGQTCFRPEGEDAENVCGTSVTVGSPLETIPEINGLFIDVDQFDSGDLAVAWYDYPRGNLMYVASSEGSFEGTTPVLLEGELPDGDDEDTNPDDAGDYGYFPSVTVAADQSVHLTYVDATKDRLMYRTLDGVAEVVDSGIASTAPGLIGDDSSLLVLDDGTLHVAYQNSTRHLALVRRRHVGTGWLVPSIVMGDEEDYDGAFGFYLQQVQAGDTVYVVSYRINTRAGVRDVVIRAAD